MCASTDALLRSDGPSLHAAVWLHATALVLCTLAVACGRSGVEAGPDADERVAIIVTLADQVDRGSFGDLQPAQRRGGLVRALRTQADTSQSALQGWMRDHGATDIRPLWIVNGIAATVTPALERALRQRPDVAAVTRDVTLRAPAALPAAAAAAPAWNLDAIHARDLWQLGVNGAGVVVANMDTGVDLEHADLGSRWRGGSDSWWDPYTGSTVPYDALGHGTETMGIMVGGSGSGTPVGVAPGATFIAAKIFDDRGDTSVSVIHQAFQWLLMPSGLPDAPDFPDVVNASWSLPTVNGCDTTFQSDFEALRAAGIVVVFAAGNSGPRSATSVSPANNGDGFAAGAVDDSGAVADFSSRGASACDGGIFPDLVAPGANVLTSSLSLGGVPQYTYVTGSSFSAPHVAAVAALLLGAWRPLAVADLEETLRTTARDLGAAGPDDDSGYGLVDAAAAYAALPARAPLVITSASPLASARVGQAYAQPLAGSGGVRPYAWSIRDGALPSGLTLAGTTGVVSGVPTSCGSWAFTVGLSDARAATTSKPLSLTVVD